MLPYSEASERNKAPILAVLEDAFHATRVVLEIGSGTGQHAVHFAAHLPHLTWQPSDHPDALAGLARRVQQEAPANVNPPRAIDVRDHPWGFPADGVFTANTFHIMAWEEVEQFFQGVGEVLEPGGTLCVYGPFKYGGRCTTDSNTAFDHSLRRQAPHMGIRDFEAVDTLARARGLSLVADHAMPANNQLLVWRRRGAD